jgi:hypothetical protein
MWRDADRRTAGETRTTRTTVGASLICDKTAPGDFFRENRLKLNQVFITLPAHRVSMEGENTNGSTGVPASGEGETKALYVYLPSNVMRRQEL